MESHARHGVPTFLSTFRIQDASGAVIAETARYVLDDDETVPIPNDVHAEVVTEIHTAALNALGVHPVPRARQRKRPRKTIEGLLISLIKTRQQPLDGVDLRDVERAGAHRQE